MATVNNNGHNSATIDTTSSPPAAQQEEEQIPRQTTLSRLNDFLHRDYISDLAFYGFWLGFWLLMPPVIFFGTLGLALYDLFTIKGYRKPCGAVLITTCDSGLGNALVLALAEKGWKVCMCNTYLDACICESSSS